MNDEDLQHLRLLTIFHYIVAGIAGVFSLFPVIHLIVGLVMLAGGFEGDAGASEARFVGMIFVAIAGTFILLGLTFAVLLAVAGRSLALHRNYTFCLVMAGIACVFMPFGTVLGVFTIIVLMRDSVRRLFGRPVSSGDATAV
jgi:hypothetical protein